MDMDTKKLFFAAYENAAPKGKLMFNIGRVALKICLFTGLALVISGCQTLNDVIVAKTNGTEGTSVEYLITKNQAWDIAKTVLRWEGVDAIEERRDQNYMVTSTGMSIGTVGTVIGVWVENGSKPELVKVTVVTKRRIVLNAITSLTESTYQKSFAKAVAIVRSGKELPLATPKDSV